MTSERELRERYKLLLHQPEEFAESEDARHVVVDMIQETELSLSKVVELLNQSRPADLSSEGSPKEDSRWIPVSERLPEVEKTVWIYHSKVMQLGYRGYSEVSKESWWYSAYTDSMIHDEVTHWISLPLVPPPTPENPSSGERGE